jgi:hypothetical protein
MVLQCCLVNREITRSFGGTFLTRIFVRDYAEDALEPVPSKKTP